jgi:hypothetical protein
VERRNTIPILSNVLLSAERGRLSFSATDLDMEIIDEAEARVEQAGQITAPAHTLYEIARKLPEGAEVTLAWTGEDPRLSVSAGRSRFSLPVLPAGDFPVMSSDGLSGRVGLDVNDLIRLIDRTRFAISTEETRYYLNGLYLHTVTEGGLPRLRAVAPDGHRLALAELPAPEGSAGAPGVIVPRKTIGEARRLLDDAGEEVGVDIAAAQDIADHIIGAQGNQTRQQCSQPGGTSTFDHQVHRLGGVGDGGGDLFVVDGDHIVDEIFDNGKRQFTGLFDRDAVGDGPHRFDAHGVARRQRRSDRVTAGCLHADDAVEAQRDLVRRLVQHGQHQARHTTLSTTTAITVIAVVAVSVAVTAIFVAGC